MIIRARPKYLEKISDFSTIEDYAVQDNEFYFNTGRAALKFYLIFLSNKLNKKISIAMQNFNCNVVADAALEANCKLYFLDIKLTDFSVSCTEVKKIANEIDVLLLTHYQGIPNFEYLEIIKVCQENNILVIEDLAQTYDSSIYNIKVGTQGNVSISSYAFDKPFSAFSGGKLEIINKESNDTEEINNLYICLNEESIKNAKLDLNILFFLYKYTDKNYYINGMDSYLVLKVLIKLKIKSHIVYKIATLLKFKLINKIVNKLLSFFINNKNIEVLRLNKIKINLIKKQEKQYNYIQNKIFIIQKLCKKNNIKIVKNNDVLIHWNRYSVLDKSGLLKEYFTNKDVQVGNFNWPVTLSKLYFENKNVVIASNLSNSEYVSKNIINIPIWSDIRC